MATIGYPVKALPALSLADLHAFPMLRCLALAPEGLALLREYDNVLRWFERLLERASVVATATSFERT